MIIHKCYYCGSDCEETNEEFVSKCVGITFSTDFLLCNECQVIFTFSKSKLDGILLLDIQDGCFVDFSFFNRKSYIGKYLEENNYNIYNELDVPDEYILCSHPSFARNKINKLLLFT